MPPLSAVETLSMQNPLFEKCTIYDGGARRYEIHEHIEEVLEFWNGILERADKHRQASAARGKARVIRCRFPMRTG